MERTGKEVWDHTKELLGSYKVVFTPHFSSSFLKNPALLGSILSRYKFASKMASNAKSILELGCGEGIGVSILAEQAQSYLGVDPDADSIHRAKENFSSEKCRFTADSYLGKIYGSFDAVVCIDAAGPEIVRSAAANAGDEGLVILGCSSPLPEMRTYFHQVLPFSMSDEIVHSGREGSGNFSMFICCHKR